MADEEQLGSYKPDDTVPSQERQAALEAAYQKNVAEGKPPYQGVELRTLGELHWVIAARGWSVATKVKYLGVAFRGGATPVNLAGAYIVEAGLSSIVLGWAILSGMELHGMDLSNATLDMADLSGADLGEASLSGATLDGANLCGASLSFANLSSASLVGCRMDVTTDLIETQLDATTKLADVRWNDAPLTRIDWSAVPTIGDEAEARRPIDEWGRHKEREARVDDYTAAARAYRQLAIALRTQGMNDIADRYAYRAQLMQRAVLRLRRQLVRWVFSGLLDALAGYGFKPERTLFAYLTAISGFAVVYFLLGQTVGPHLSPLGSVVFSMTSFHGRGFFPGGIALDDPLTVVAAVEAFVGLVVEVSFIATFTQRFFAH